MGYYKISDATLTAIADAIRRKIGTSAKILVADLATRIDGISTPKEEQSKSVTINANGTQTVSPDAGKVLSGVTVNVNVPSTSPVLQTKAVSPATSVQRVSPDAGYDGLSAVTVEAVTAAIDSNIQPANIAAGVTILGVTGTHSGGAQLHAPTIGISGDTLTITDGNNGSFAQKFAIYADGTKRAETTAASYDLYALGLSAGTYAITVKAVGSGMTDSAASNSVSYTVIQIYTITPTLTNVTAAASNPSSIAAGSTATLTFTANTGYNLPDTVTVTGATPNWDQATGTLTLSNPTGNVIIAIIGEATQAGHTISLTVLSLGEIACDDGTTIKINSAPTSSADWDYGTCYADTVGQGKNYELYNTDQLIQHTTGSSYSKISQPKTISDVTSIWVYWSTTYSDACITVNGIDYYPQDHAGWNNALEIPITTDCDVVMRVSYD